jgi:hypothetical protein
MDLGEPAAEGDPAALQNDHPECHISFEVISVKFI